MVCYIDFNRFPIQLVVNGSTMLLYLSYAWWSAPRNTPFANAELFSFCELWCVCVQWHCIVLGVIEC